MLFGKRLKKRFIGLAGLLVVGVTVHFLDEQRPQSLDLFSELPEAPSEPDYYSVNSTFREYNPQGILSRSLYSERLVHYPDSETATLQAPEIITYDVQARPLWRAEADAGLVEGDGSHFQLNQNVIVWQLAEQRSEGSGTFYDPALSDSPESNISLKLTTEQLNINLDEDYADTEKAVRIDTVNGTTRAVGMFADLNSQQIQLKSQVKGIYKPDGSAPEQAPPTGNTQENQDADTVKTDPTKAP